VASDDGSQSCTGSVSYEEGLLAVVGYIPIPGFTEFCKEKGSTSKGCITVLVQFLHKGW